VLKILLIVTFFSWTSFGDTSFCSSSYLEAKNAELNIKDSFPQKITPETISQFKLNNDLDMAAVYIKKSGLKKSEQEIINDLFHSVEYRKAWYLLESWISEGKPRTTFFSKLKYLVFGKLSEISEKDIFIKTLATMYQDERAWKGFNELLGKRFSKRKIDKVVRYLNLLNIEANSRSAAPLFLNKYLRKVEAKEVDITKIDENLKKFIRNSFWRYLTFRSINGRYNRLRDVQRIQDFFRNGFKSLFDRSTLNGDVVEVVGSRELLKKYDFLDENSVTHILASDKRTEILQKIDGVKEIYPHNFLALVLSESTGDQMPKVLDNLKSHENMLWKINAVFEKIKWKDNKSIREIFRQRNIEKEDAAITAIRLVENVAAFSRFNGRIGRVEDVAKYINDAFDVLATNTNSETFGVNQLIKELGGDSDPVNTKFLGAHFTLSYFKRLVKEKAFSEFIGFEVPMFFVRDNYTKKGFFLFGDIQNNKEVLRIVDYKTGEFLKDSHLQSTVEVKNGKCFEIIKSVLTLSPCSRRKGVYKVMHRRRADIGYKKGSKYHFAEMKNYQDLQTLYEFRGQESNISEWAFDLFGEAMKGQKFNFSWVLNNDASTGASFDKYDLEFKNILNEKITFKPQYKLLKGFLGDKGVNSKLKSKFFPEGENMLFHEPVVKMERQYKTKD